jgi:SAM-dependent methyltransferase
MRQILSRPEVYQLYQVAGGFFGARIKAFRDYVDFSGVRRVFDIGCGPGHIVNHMPSGIDYIGFDTESRYIDFANARWKGRGRFVSLPFDRSSAEAYGKPDLILMNGVLHHMDDATAACVVRDAAEVLADDGLFFALDGCFRPGQNPIARYLLEKDRGEYVREAGGYEGIVRQAFTNTQVFVRDDLSWAPYTFAITTGRR